LFFCANEENTPEKPRKDLIFSDSQCIIRIAMKQRKLKDKNTKRLDVILPEKLYNAIAETAKEEQKSKGMIVEEIIQDWLTESNKQKVDHEQYMREIVAMHFSKSF